MIQTEERVSHRDMSDNYVYQRSILAYLETAKKFFLCLSSFLMFQITSAQNSKELPCNNIKNSTVYFYPQNIIGCYQFDITNDTFKITNAVNDSDILFFNLKWVNECSMELNYIPDKSSTLIKGLPKFLKKHKIYCEITKQTEDYFIANSRLDKLNSKKMSVDTFWTNKKGLQFNETKGLFKEITKQVIMQEAIVDTSKYALLYVYRPWKLTNSLGNFTVCINDIPVIIANNGNGYIFKIFKEDSISVTSKLLKDISTCKFKIQFGKIYYAKAMIHWTISKRLYNFALEMKAMDSDIGRKECEKLKFKE